jgi:putative membrane protein
MKRNSLTRIFLSGILMAATLQACQSKQDPEAKDTIHNAQNAAPDSLISGTTPTMKDGTPENKFMEQAILSGLVEIQMAKIAAEKGSSRRIKDFAATITKDQSAANTQLTTLASAKSVRLPTALPKIKQENLKDLNKLSGRDFDSYFINMMVEDRIQDIALYRGAIAGSDSTIKAFAISVLPLLQKHYTQGRELSLKYDQNKKKK